MERRQNLSSARPKSDFSLYGNDAWAKERFARLRLFRTPGIGVVTYTKLMLKVGTAVDIIAQFNALQSKGVIKRSVNLVSETVVEKELDAHRKIGAQLLVQGDQHYPKQLVNVFGAPPVISVMGNLSLLKKGIVAIVGARNCSLTGRQIAQLYAKELCENNMATLSGLARGIDAEVHTASLQHGTIAVIAGGIDQEYPPEHIALRQKIVDTGLLIAESPFGTEPRADLFPKRNRLIAALASGVVVIEAASRSGSLITANYANELNRPLFVVPGSPMDPRYSGSIELLRHGAHVSTTPQDVLDILQEPHRIALHEASFENYGNQPNPEHDAQEELFAQTEPAHAYIAGMPQDLRPLSVTDEILEHLSQVPIFLDELLESCTYSTQQVMAEITRLELDEEIIRHPGDRYSKSPTTF